MSRSIFTIALCLCPLFLLAQLKEAPLSSNSQLENVYNSQANNTVSLMTNCPNLNGAYQYVIKGEILQVKIDTAGIGFSVDPVFTIVECDNQADQGTVSINGDFLNYEAPDLDGYQENICVEYCPDNLDCTNITFTFVTQRPTQTHILPTLSLNEEETLEDICFDPNELPGELQCNVFFNCSSDYDNRLAKKAWMTYSEATSCFKYTSGLGAGVDTVCAVLCDEFGVCDYYKQPIQINSYFIDLPFWDDFSDSGSPYTRSDRWVSKDAFVNNTMAENPPSVGMATLDGLDYTGSPYPSSGTADYLTSRGLKLGNFNSQDQLGLRFFVSPKGNGLYPNGPDSLLVQFKNTDNEWITRWSSAGIDTSLNLSVSPPFVFVTLGVPDEFKYDGFQFRFVNAVSPTGLYDLWHIDYVRLANGEPFTKEFDDVAFVDIPNSLLQEYEHMPWKHFLADIDNQIDIFDFESVFYNHQSFTSNPANDSDIKLRELTTGTEIPVNLNVLDATNVPSQEYSFFSKTLPEANASVIKNTITTDLSTLDKAELELEYSFTLASQQQVNDKVSRVHHFDNYFAYDDGSAERQIYLENPQTDNPMLAMEFESKIEDSLRAVQFHFPHINGNAENQIFSLHIFLDNLDEEPEFTMNFLSPLYADTPFDTLQGFTTILLRDIFTNPAAIPLDAGQKFYIAFQQLTTTNFGIPIGLDLNKNNADKLYLNVWNSWINQADYLVGTPMIRAVVGSDDITPTANKEILADDTTLKIWPNPANEFIQLESSSMNSDYEIMLFNTNGALLLRDSFKERLNVEQLKAGLYILAIKDPFGQVISRNKIVIIK